MVLVNKPRTSTFNNDHYFNLYQHVWHRSAVDFESWITARPSRSINRSNPTMRHNPLDIIPAVESTVTSSALLGLRLLLQAITGIVHIETKS